MRILLFADIHIGAIKDTTYVFNTITDVIEKEVVLNKTDMVVILGDYFDRLFKANEEYVALSINVMSYLIRACKRSNTKLRLIYGTYSHEMDQYKLFNHHFGDPKIDIKLFNTVTEEEVNGKRILYIPEEYMMDKHEFYKDYLYSDKKYDYIFGHGVIIEGMPIAANVKTASNKKEKQVPRFKSEELSKVSKLTIFGHHHHMTDMNRVFYLGSFFRSSFGEEEDKGYGIIEDDKLNFIKNDKAYIYKTYMFDENSSIYENSDNIIKELNKIKNDNMDIFNNIIIGKIRIKFKLSDKTYPSFKEDLLNIIKEDKHISINIEDNRLMFEENSEDDEYDFLLDANIGIDEKIHSFINKQYDLDISLTQIKKYITEPFKIE